MQLISCKYEHVQIDGCSELAGVLAYEKASYGSFLFACFFVIDIFISSSPGTVHSQWPHPSTEEQIGVNFLPCNSTA